MENPREAEVWGKKPEVADRTLNERKYCKLCDYYYSEMFTCPICYGERRAEERIINLLEVEFSQEMSERAGYIMTENNYPVRWADLMDLIKKKK